MAVVYIRFDLFGFSSDYTCMDFVFGLLLVRFHLYGFCFLASARPISPVSILFSGFCSSNFTSDFSCMDLFHVLVLFLSVLWLMI